MNQSQLKIANQNLSLPISLSVLGHILIVLFFVVKAKFFPSDIPIYERSIRVDMVALPEKITTPPKPQIKKETPKPEPKPKPKPEPKPKPKPKVKPKKKNLKKKLLNAQSNALKKLQQQSAFDKLKDIEEKKPEKEIEYKGNIIAAGTSLTGIHKLQHEDYQEKIDVHVKQFWEIPLWMENRNFKAQAVAKLDTSGYLISVEIVKSSGDQQYDDLVESTIRKAAPFPIPPGKFKDIVAEDGILLGFPE